MTERTHRIRCGRFETYFMEAGRVGRPILFLIHDGGLGADANVSWDPVIRELHADYHIFAIDLYGFGRSDMLFHFGRRPYESHIEQIADVSQALGIKAAHYIGTSYGGSVVLRAAESAFSWPMLSGMSISGTGGVFRHEDGKRRLAETEPNEASLRRFLQLIVREDWPGIEDNVQQRLQNALQPGHWEALAAPRLRSPCGRAASSAVDSYPATLRDCDVPILIVEGTRDPLLEEHWASRIAKHTPKGRAMKIDASHSPNLDDPALIAEIIRDFVVENDA